MIILKCTTKIDWSTVMVSSAWVAGVTNELGLGGSRNGVTNRG
jgi:hypothetical protein